MKVKTSVYLYQETRAQVEQIAKELDRKPAWVMTAALVAGIKELQKKHQIDAPAVNELKK